MNGEDPLSLEKLKINERLQSLELSNARIISHLESEKGTWERYTTALYKIIDHLKETTDEHEKILYKEPGILIKLDRLEQSNKEKSTNIRMIWGALTGFIAKIVYDLFRH